jgi:hypothetical protein
MPRASNARVVLSLCYFFSVLLFSKLENWKYDGTAEGQNFVCLGVGVAGWHSAHSAIISRWIGPGVRSE